MLIGAFEAGFYPTAVAYLSIFYCRFDLGVRIGLFYGQYAIAGHFLGPLVRNHVFNHVRLALTSGWLTAYGVFKINHGPLKNWQYLFVIEGVLTCIMGLIAWIWLPSGPGTAWFLKKEDRAFAAQRIQQDHAMYTQHQYSESVVEEDRLTKRDIIETTKDWKLWCVLVFNICASVPSTAFSVFMPLVVHGMGYSSLSANLVCHSLMSSLYAIKF